MHKKNFSGYFFPQIFNYMVGEIFYYMVEEIALRYYRKRISKEKTKFLLGNFKFNRKRLCIRGVNVAV